MLIDILLGIATSGWLTAVYLMYLLFNTKIRETYYHHEANALLERLITVNKRIKDAQTNMVK